MVADAPNGEAETGGEHKGEDDAATELFLGSGMPQRQDGHKELKRHRC